MFHKINHLRCGQRTRKITMRPTTVLFFLWCPLAAGLVHAQSTGRGNIVGTVTDPNGAVIPSATVTAKNTETNVAIATQTNNTGYFELDSLDAGPYQVSVASTGFQKYVQNGIVLNASASLDLKLVLKIGSANAVVTVTAEAPLLDTQSALNGQSLTTR